MRWQKKISQEVQAFLHVNLKSTHGRIILCGLFVGLCYFPFWLGVLITRAGGGSSGLPLMLGIVYCGLHQLWKQRLQLAAVVVSDEDRLLGHILIICGVVLFPFCRSTIGLQAIIWLLILFGIACSSWGLSFFGKNATPTALMILSVYPKPGETMRALWEIFTPPQMLERFMAWSGSLALQAIGQPATVTGVIIALPKGAVKVAWGCNGFSMAFTMVVAGLVLGLFLKQSRSTIITMMITGAILALIFNIPRIMLVTLAAVYWGDYWFHFWHGSWGSQVFVGILFTLYYYVVMGVIKKRIHKPVEE